MRYLSWILVVIYLTLAVCGCIGDRLYYPRKVPNERNTFRLSPNTWGEQVVRVQVWNYDKSKKMPVWLLQANREVPVKGFTVTVGAVPDGFTQVIPAPPETFEVEPEKQYDIAITTDFQGAHPGGKTWIAE